MSEVCDNDLCIAHKTHNLDIFNEGCASMGDINECPIRKKLLTKQQPCPECGGSGEYCPIKESCNKPNTCHEEFTDELGDKYPHCEMICACKCKGTGTKEAL